MLNAIALTPAEPVRENVHYLGTGGRSAAARRSRFSPAYLDRDTGRVLPSRFADGRLAAVHVLNGLPPELVAERSPGGRVRQVKPGVVAGFLRDDRFYTREEAFRTRQAEIDALLLAA